MDLEQQQQFQASNFQQLSDPTFIKLKLDTNQLLERTESFLSASRMVLFKGEDGNLYEKKEEHGKPLANEIGVANIMNMLNMTANSHSVQGNTKTDVLANLLADTREEFTLAIVLNSYEWGIDDSKLDYIVDNLMRFLSLFLSRTVDNKERESLMSQFHSKEVISQQPKKEGLIQNFAGGFN